MSQRILVVDDDRQGVLSVALLANQQVSGDFRQFLAQNQLQDSPLITQLSAYYATHGDWDGVADVFRTLPTGAGAGRGMRRGAPAFVLADAGGRVVYDGSGNQLIQIAPQELAAAAAIRWHDRTVGYLLVRGASGQSDLPMAAQRYLAQVNATLIQAGLLAGLLGLLLGVLIARGLAAPLGRLASAARQMAQGKLDERVPIVGAAEVADVARAFNEMAASLVWSPKGGQGWCARSGSISSCRPASLSDTRRPSSERPSSVR